MEGTIAEPPPPVGLSEETDQDLSAPRVTDLLAGDVGSFSGPDCAQDDLWRAVRDSFDDLDADTRIRSVLNSVGADRVLLTERFLADSDDRRCDRVKLHYPISDVVDSSGKWASFTEAYNHMNRSMTDHGCTPPKFTCPGSALHGFITARAPFVVQDLPSDERGFLDLAISCMNGCLDLSVRDMAIVPLSGSDPTKHVRALNFTGGRLFKNAEAFRNAAAAILYIVGLEQVNRAVSSRDSYELSDRELEVYTWAIKGKTAEETAIITGLSGQSIRYSLYRVRDVLGYATVAQALVHVARTYDISP